MTRRRGPTHPYSLLAGIVLLGAASCALAGDHDDRPVLRLATTTSTYDSGLLGAILPAFEKESGARVDVIAVGTGQALALGAAGDADVLLVHARDKEDAFLAAGHGTERREVMYNDFIIVGPGADPAGIRGMTSAPLALARIATREAVFASRGDDSGTHSKELALWKAAGLTAPAKAGWYRSLGQGMGATLRYASETGGYTLTDRGTWLSQRGTLGGLEILVGGASLAENRDPALTNRYGVIPVNPLKNPAIQGKLAARFVTWLTSPETQAAIGAFGRDRFGQPLFHAVLPSRSHD